MDEKGISEVPREKRRGEVRLPAASRRTAS